jgi:hypothetical protein
MEGKGSIREIAAVYFGSFLKRVTGGIPGAWMQFRRRLRASGSIQQVFDAYVKPIDSVGKK